MTIDQISTAIGTVNGSFSKLTNDATGDIAFSGVGDLTPFGLSTESTVIAHISSNGDFVASFCDSTDGTPYWGVISTLSGGQNFTLNLTPNNFEITGSNGTGIIIDDITQLINMPIVPAYADNASAVAAGLTVGSLYKTTTSGSTYMKIVT